MGSFFTNFWWGGDPDIPDKLSGLSKRDIYTIQRNWTTIYAKSGEYGMELFLRLFRKDRNTQNFFRNVSGLPEDEIKKSVIFKAHVQILMGSFNSAVVNLNTPEVVVALMNKLGTSHHSRHVKISHFAEFKAILIEFFTEDLKLDTPTIDSLNRFLTFMFQHIYENLKD